MLLNRERASCALVLAAVVISVGRVGMAGDRLGLPPQPIPANNPLTSEKIELGRTLFHDTRFSANGSISCASCHLPQRLYTDGRAVGVGFNGKEGTRNAPTVMNAGYYSSLFWDGRAASLEEQAKGPLVNPIEHGLKNYDPILRIARTDANYQREFKRAFGVDPAQIKIDHVAMAIASYERTLVVGDSPFDRYQYGGDKHALSASAIAGLKVFSGKGKCSVCHLIGKSDAIFTDNQYHNIGVGLLQIQGRLNDVVNAVIEEKLRGRSVDHSVLTAENVSQLGRFAVTLNPTDIATFRTPSLRNVALTAPYMHDGSLKTLEEVVQFYGKGGSGSTLQHPTIRKLRLTKEEERQLVDFMKSLTSTKYANLDIKPIQTARGDRVAPNNGARLNDDGVPNGRARLRKVSR